jgi:hypothetical protein
MYEVVLQDDQPQRIRVTDHPLRLGQRLEIDAAMWIVVSEQPADDPDVDARYLLTRVEREPPPRRRGAA